MVDPVLAGFIAAYEAKPWQPGRVDCCLALAAWAIWLGHSDPAEHMRGTYDSEDGYRAIFKQYGGVVPFVASCAAKISAKSIQSPQSGDIGVIGSPTTWERQFGAIFDGERWRVRFINGYGAMIAPPLAIWRI